MSTLSDQLRTLHRLRRHGRDLQQELDRAPIQLKARKAVAAKAAQAATDAADTLKKLKVSVRDQEAQLKATQAQIGRYEAQSNDTRDATAYEALKREIAHAREKAQQQEDAIFAGLEEIDTQTSALPAIEAAGKAAQAVFTTWEKDHAARQTRMAGDLKRTADELKAAEAQLPVPVKPLYTRLVSAYGADCLAAIVENSCTQCRTQVTVQHRADVVNGEFVTCRSCGRGLYLAEAAAPVAEA